MKNKRIIVISPPFYSHFTPMLVLSENLKEAGADVVVGCSREFEQEVQKAGLMFRELDISKNRNTGAAEQTKQPEEESKRLEAFFEATYRGPVETLKIQSEHRKADMLDDPETMIEKLKEIENELSADWYLVDVLSYNVTLALKTLALPFMTFCPPHPHTIPKETNLYGVPPRWPERFQLSTKESASLIETAEQTKEEFTQIFNQVLRTHGQESQTVRDAFKAVSDDLILYNYPPFDVERDEGPAKSVFLGSCFKEQELGAEWKAILQTEHRKFLITLGTFLSSRADVLEKLISSVRQFDPEAIILVSAGANAETLTDAADDRVFIRSFLPQAAVLPYMDAVLFHGGCNTFTETLFYGKPMIILPFSSDQFNVAYDAEKEGLAEVHDPNAFSVEEIERSLSHLLTDTTRSMKWQKVIRSLGPKFGAEQILTK